jgi:glucoamylase
MARSRVLRPWVVVVAAILVASLLVLALTGLAEAAPSSSSAPGAPGDPAVWTPADKDGFGTSKTTTSKVWYTLNNGELTEVYYPNLGTPSVRDLQFIVSDGKTFADLETDATTQHVQLVDNQALEYRQIDTDKDGKYRITKTYVTDPARSTVLVDVNFESLSGKPYQLYALYDPALNNGGGNDTATSQDGQLLASDAKVASALVAAPGFGQVSSGYLGTSDGWTDLKDDYKMDWNYRSASSGNVVQTARTSVNGLPGNQQLTLSLGFGGDKVGALGEAQGSLANGFQAAETGYQAGWHGYLDTRPVKAAPASVGSSGSLEHTSYDVSLMTLAAHEDKTYRGAYIASPTMPWVWGTDSQVTPELDRPLDYRGEDETSGAYHLVWSRDLYQIATALLAAGDQAGAKRALTYLFDRQQNKEDGSFPQNSTVDGAEHWNNVQLDEVAFPLVLAWQLGQTDGKTYRDHVKKAADYIVANGPQTPQERWENQGGYSPATIAAEIAGLVCAADIARANGDQATADIYLQKADAWKASVDSWTATTNGPYSSQPYYLRLTKDGNPNAGTPYNIGDSGPDNVDQRAVVDPSYLELVRLGVKRWDDPTVLNTITVVDSQLGVSTPNGTFWHRYNFDGYGEQADGSPWDVGFPAGSQATIGRIWPIFAGERGEYELAAGGSASSRLQSIAASGNEGYMLPEQVWDDNDPSGQSGFPTGEGTFSATPLAWTHAQFVRLAWSIQDGRPVEQPQIVACRYTGNCPN